MFALNLWGVFEIGMPRIFGHFAITYGQKETPTAHFMSGLFATLLATPCSAPFLGTAMGFALTQSSGTIMAAFAVAGTGMALPYFILAAFPGSLGWLAEARFLDGPPQDGFRFYPSDNNGMASVGVLSASPVYPSGAFR